jgi:hypothetical protein
MQITRIDQQTHDELKRLFEDNPELRLQNRGYEYIGCAVREAKAPQLARIAEILKQHITGFHEFHNFRTGKEGEIVLRFDYDWGAEDKTLRFCGVGYLPLDHLRDGFLNGDRTSSS